MEFKSENIFVIALAMVASIVVWSYTTFATQVELKDRYKATIEHSDMNRDRMISLIQQTHDLAEKIDARTWEMQKELNRRK